LTCSGQQQPGQNKNMSYYLILQRGSKPSDSDLLPALHLVNCPIKLFVVQAVNPIRHALDMTDTNHISKQHVGVSFESRFGQASGGQRRRELKVQWVHMQLLSQLGRDFVIGVPFAEIEREGRKSSVFLILGLEFDYDSVEDVLKVLRDRDTHSTFRKLGLPKSYKITVGRSNVSLVSDYS
jgi:hypothetical protein